MSDVSVDDIERVLAEIDAHGLPAFMARYPQLGMPRTFWMISPLRPGQIYPSKPVAAAALNWQNINGGYGTRDSACNVLERAGYVITDRDGNEINQLGSDLKDLEGRKRSLDQTTYKRLVDARIGQGWFRNTLLARWHGTCALTGIKTTALLRASHIKPWAESEDSERLDGANGLLLASHVDALFDRYLLSFEEDGELIWSDDVSSADREILALPNRLRATLSNEENHYLVAHRIACAGNCSIQMRGLPWSVAARSP